MQIAKFGSILVLLILSGCSTVVQQSAAVWGVITFKEDPVPVYVTPLLYEENGCVDLEGYHHVMGEFANAANQQMSRRMKDIAVPENRKLSQWQIGSRFVRRHNLPIDLDVTWYEAFVLAWGHYEAIHKAQLTKQCGLHYKYGLLPWQEAKFSW